MSGIAETTIEEIRDRILELRLRRDQAEADFYTYLVHVEENALQIILDSGMNSYDEFVKPYVNPATYRAFKAGMEKIGGETTALGIGSYATCEAPRLPDGAEDRYVEEVRDWVAANRRLPSKEVSARIAQNCGAPPKHSKTEGFRNENARLKDEVNKLKAEIRSLKATIGKLESELAKAKGGPSLNPQPTA